MSCYANQCSSAESKENSLISRYFGSLTVIRIVCRLLTRLICVETEVSLTACYIRIITFYSPRRCFYDHWYTQSRRSTGVAISSLGAMRIYIHRGLGSLVNNCRLSSKLPRRAALARRLAILAYISLEETSHTYLLMQRRFT